MILKKYFNYLLIVHLILLTGGIMFSAISGYNRSIVPVEVYEMGKGTVNICNVTLIMVGLLFTFIGNIMLFWKSRTGFICFSLGNILGLLGLLYCKWYAASGISFFLGQTPLLLAGAIIATYIYEWNA